LVIAWNGTNSNQYMDTEKYLLETCSELYLYLKLMLSWCTFEASDLFPTILKNIFWLQTFILHSTKPKSFKHHFKDQTLLTFHKKIVKSFVLIQSFKSSFFYEGIK
jgi:hypothetical protein